MKGYKPQITPESPATCALCGWVGTQESMQRHLACWDEAKPIKPQCPGVRFYIDPNPATWTTIDRYSILTRENVLAGMPPKKAAREAAYAVGYKTRPEPMTDEVKAMLKERNDREREISKGMKKRGAAKRKGRGRRRA